MLIAEPYRGEPAAPPPANPPSAPPPADLWPGSPDPRNSHRPAPEPWPSPPSALRPGLPRPALPWPSLLALFPLAFGSLPLAQPVLHRLQAAHEVAHPLQGRRPLVPVGRRGGARRLLELLPQRLEIGADLAFELAALLGAPGAHHGLRVPDLVLQLLVADGRPPPPGASAPRPSCRAARPGPCGRARLPAPRPRWPGRPCARAAAPAPRRSSARRQLLRGFRGDLLLRARQLLRLARRVLHALLEAGPSACPPARAARRAAAPGPRPASPARSARRARAASASWRWPPPAGAARCPAWPATTARGPAAPAAAPAPRSPWPGRAGTRRRLRRRPGSAAARTSAARARPPAPGGGPARAAAPAPRPPVSSAFSCEPRWTVSYWFFSLSSSSSKRSARSSAFMAEPPPPRRRPARSSPGRRGTRPPRAAGA